MIEIVFLVATACVALVVGLRLVQGFRDVDHWVEAEASFVEGHVEREVQWDGEGETVTGDYVVSVVYEYVDPFDQLPKRGDNVLAGGRISLFGGAIEKRIPLTLPKDRAEALLEDLRRKGSFPVYINPDDPRDHGIVRMRDLGTDPGLRRR